MGIEKIKKSKSLSKKIFLFYQKKVLNFYFHFFYFFLANKPHIIDKSIVVNVDKLKIKFKFL